MSKLVVNTIDNLGSYEGTIKIFNLNTIGKMETITLTPFGNQNNFALGVNTSNKVHSYVHINANSSFWISGISTKGFDPDKRITIRNTSNTYSNQSSVIAFNRQDEWISSAANLLFWTQNTMPVFCMPGEEVTWEYRNNILTLIDGTRYGAPSMRSIFDEKLDPNMFSLANGNTGAGSVTRAVYDNWTGGNRILMRCRQDRCTSNGDYVVFHSGYAFEHRIGGNGCGSILLTAMNEYSTRPNVTNNITHWTGLHTGYIGDATGVNGYSFMAANNIQRGIGVVLDGTANNWSFTTRNNYTSTASSPPLAMPPTDGKLRWFAFINGDATRVEFCCAADVYNEGGDYWWRYFYTHTTNIPKTGTGGPYSNVGMTLGTTMAKHSGAGLNNHVYTSLFGMMGKGDGTL